MKTRTRVTLWSCQHYDDQPGPTRWVARAWFGWRVRRMRAQVLARVHAEVQADEARARDLLQRRIARHTRDAGIVRDQGGA